MVMSKQPDGMRRVKRSTGEDGKTSEYTIFLTQEGGETEVGYSRRVVKGSTSKWEGYLRTGEGTYQVFPDEYRDHNALMTDLRDKWVDAHPGGAPLVAQGAPKPAKSEAGQPAPEAAPPAEPDFAGQAEPAVAVTEPDGSEEVVVAVQDAAGAVAAVVAEAAPDSAPEAPLAAPDFGGDPLADPLRDPLSPAFLPPG